MRVRSGSRIGRRLVIAAVVLIALVGATGCGDDADPDEEDPDPTTTVASGDDVEADPPEGAEGAEDDATDEASGATITIVGFDFGEPLTVAPGATVTVTNDDGVAHTWTANDGSFDSGSIDPGGSYEHSFDEPGEFDFFCEIHQSMTGSITVTA